MIYVKTRLQHRASEIHILSLSQPLLSGFVENFQKLPRFWLVGAITLDLRNELVNKRELARGWDYIPLLQASQYHVFMRDLTWLAPAGNYTGGAHFGATKRQNEKQQFTAKRLAARASERERERDSERRRIDAINASRRYSENFTDIYQCRAVASPLIHARAQRAKCDKKGCTDRTVFFEGCRSDKQR